VAVLLGVTVLALGALTAAIGGIVSSNAASADAASVAADLDDALRPVEATGPHRGSVSFSGGELSVVERELRVLSDAGNRTVRIDALAFDHRGHRVTYLAGAVVRGRGDSAQLASDPPITASRGDGGVLVVGAAKLNASHSTVGANKRVTLPLRTDVSHERIPLGNGTYRVAVETATPDPWLDYFERLGADVSVEDLDGDGIDSVVAGFPGERTAYLVVHDLRLSIGGTESDDGSQEGPDDA
jgi:hypothetical protein